MADLLQIEREMDAVQDQPVSPLFGSPRLKEMIVDAALAGQITTQDAEDMIEEYGLRGV